MAPTFQTEELLRLCGELVEGVLQESEAAELSRMLGTDLAAQQFYLRFMEVHALLALDYSAGSTPAAMPGGSSMPRVPLVSPSETLDLFETADRPAPPVLEPRAGSYSTGPLVLAFAAGVSAALLLIGLVSLLIPAARLEEARHPSMAVSESRSAGWPGPWYRGSSSSTTRSGIRWRRRSPPRCWET